MVVLFLIYIFPAIGVMSVSMFIYAHERSLSMAVVLAGGPSVALNGRYHCSINITERLKVLPIFANDSFISTRQGFSNWLYLCLLIMCWLYKCGRSF